MSEAEQREIEDAAMFQFGDLPTARIGYIAGATVMAEKKNVEIEKLTQMVSASVDKLEAAQESINQAAQVIEIKEIELGRLQAELSRVKKVAEHLAEALKGSDRLNDNSKDVTKALTEFANLMNKEK